MKCFKCQEDVPFGSECVTCGECSAKFHYDCSIRETKWRNMSVEQRSKWACLKCKSSPNISRQNSAGSSLNELELPALKEEEVTLKTMLQQINTRLNTLDDVKKSVDEMNTSMSFLSNKYDDLIIEVREYKESNKELKKEIDDLKSNCLKKDEELLSLTMRLNALEQYGRGVNLEIHGLDDSMEDPEHTLQQVSRALGVTYNPAEISAAHRVPSRNRKNDRPQMFLVQFTRRAVKERWLRAGKRKRLLSRDIGGAGDTRVYFNENLTPYFSRLFGETRRVAKEKHYDSVWVMHGIIRVRKNQDARQSFTINTYEDLKQLV